MKEMNRGTVEINTLEEIDNHSPKKQGKEATVSVSQHLAIGLT